MMLCWLLGGLVRNHFLDLCDSQLAGFYNGIITSGLLAHDFGEALNNPGDGCIVNPIVGDQTETPGTDDTDFDAIFDQHFFYLMSI